MSQKSYTFPLGGGLDVVTPPSQKKPGRLIGAQNYEPIDGGGYRRIDGYERYSGLPSPTEASYWIVNFKAGTTLINADDVITGVTSAYTADVLQVTVTSGDWSTNDAAGFLLVFNASGAFVDNENLQVSAVTVAVADGVSTEKTEQDEATHINYMRLAIEATRTNIGQVPGAGKIRGVWGFNGKIYAFRDNVGGTACQMYVSSGSGWQLVTTPALNPAGRYEFVSHNFGGNVATQAMYGCDGKNKAFKFDGTTYTEITSGMTVDTPEHIAAHKKHLFLSFGASVQFSPIADPTAAWTPVLGAGEIATGQLVVGMDVQPGDVLAIFNRNATHLLYGTPGVDLNLVTHSAQKGAVEWTIQNMNESIYLDDRGLSSLSTTQAFGDFQASSLSGDIETFFSAQKFTPLSSVLIRSKNQYRLFFEDKSCFLMLKGRRGYQFIPVSFPVTVEAICSIENEGVEHIYFGSDDGFVYEMEKGNSFDGGDISYSLRLPFIALGYPRNKKRFYKLQIEIDSVDQIPLLLYPDYSYGRVDEPSAQNPVSNTLLFARGGYWDTDINWDEFIWDGQAVGIAESYLDGNGINISLLIHGQSNYEASHTIYSATYHYNVRGLEL